MGDLALSWWFVGPGRQDRRFGARLLLDVADCAVWSALAPDTEFATLIPMVQTAPLAAELGFTQRSRGVLVGLIAPSVVLLVRRARRQRLRLDQIVWPLVSALPGVFVTRLDRWFAERVASAQEEISARVSDARRAARSEFSLASHSVVDDLRRTAFVIEQETGGRTAWQHDAEMKEREVTWAAADERQFLHNALDDWAQRRRYPDLQARPRFRSSADDGLYVLDARQVRELHRILDRIDPIGEVPVEVLRRSRWGWASTEAILRIGSHLEALTGPPPMRLRRSDGTVATFDGTLVTQAMTAIFMLMPMIEDNGGASWTSCVPPAVAAGLHGVWAGAVTASDRPRSRALSLCFGAVTTLVHSWLVGRSMRRPHDEAGLIRFPFRFALFGFHMLVGTHARKVSIPTGLLLAGISGLSAVVAWVSTPRPRQLPVLLTDVLGAAPGFGLAWAIRTAADEMQATIALDMDAVRAGIDAERAEVIGLLEARIVALVGTVAAAENDEETGRYLNDLLDDIQSSVELLRSQRV